MGAFGWQRSEKGGSHGKSFATGNVLLPTAPQTKKRRLVWKREDAPSGEGQPSATEAPTPEAAAADTAIAGSSSTPAPAAPAGQQQDAAPTTSKQQQPKAGPAGATPARPPPASAAAQGLQARQAKLEELRRQIEQRQAQVAAAEAARAAAARRAAALEEQDHQRELRRRKLEAGFAEAFEKAKAAAAEEIAAGRAKVTTADVAEVQRVLAAKTDYDVLRMAQGADAVAVRRRYREMAVALHPDKCSVKGASDAFQRLVLAYQGVAKYAK